MKLVAAGVMKCFCTEIFEGDWETHEAAAIAAVERYRNERGLPPDAVMVGVWGDEGQTVMIDKVDFIVEAGIPRKVTRDELLKFMDWPKIVWSCSKKDE